MIPALRPLVFAFILIFSGLVLSAGHSDGQVAQKGIHKNKTKLTGGCGSCHKGHGQKKTPMLPLADSDFCLSCHGSTSRQLSMTKNKKLKEGIFLRDMEADFRKVYHHPIEVTGVHTADETLPEQEPGTKRHAACMDCHNAHHLTKENVLAGVEGSKKKVKVKDALEHEICYKCHSSSVNLPPTQKNKEEEFDPQNRSYHPVEQPGKNSRVPSLILPLTTSSTIRCSDCHSGDGFGASRGPHGSTQEHILRYRYVESVRSQESAENYALCYSCHRRESLLANASWVQHSRHINVTSCKTCHNSHGSRFYPYLIQFNPFAVLPNREGRLDFIDYGEGRFDCFLRCHDVDHTRDGVVRPQGFVPAGVKTGKK